MSKTYAEIKTFVRGAIVEGRYKPNDRLPTDNELAQQLETSRMTVHRALQELAREGMVQRSPSRGTFVSDPKKCYVGTVAFLTTSAHPAGTFADLFGALSSDLFLEGINLVPYSCNGSLSRTIQTAQQLVKSPLTGAVVVPPTDENSAEVIRVFQKAGVPVVVAGKFDIPDCEVSYVSCNNVQCGNVLAKHLLSLGHRRFAILSASHTQDVKERIRGFQDMVSQAGGTIRPEHRCEVRHLAEIPYVVKEWLAGESKPTAIFAINDILAGEVMLAVRKMGLRIPHDVAVVGVDDEPLAKVAFSPLTTVRLSSEKEGHLLASLLLGTIRGTIYEPRKIDLDCELVVRESCGAGILRKKPYF